MTGTRTGAAAGLALLGCLGFASAPSAFGQPASAQSFEEIERGRAVADAADCVACHTAPGGKPFAGGLVLATPFGNLVASNITPDRDTGIGQYAEGDLRRVLQKGIGRNGQHLYPAMPYPAYSKMTVADIAALSAYLATLDPVTNAVVSNQLPFPFDVRMSITAWNLLEFAGSGPMPYVPGKSPVWNRGAYLVDALGHCGMCHTPKTVLGADDNDHYLMGAALEGWTAPNITNDGRRGVGAWSADEIVAYLKTGANQRTIAAGPMAEVIVNSSSKMSDPDLRAIATYLLDIKPVSAGSGKTVAVLDPQMVAGGAIYGDNCAACHSGSGQGAAGLFPRLALNSVVQQDNPATLIRLVLEGSRGVATDARPTGPAMPPLGWRLDDDQAASVLTYLRNSWGNEADAVPASAVRTVREGLRRGN